MPRGDRFIHLIFLREFFSDKNCQPGNIRDCKRTIFDKQPHSNRGPALLFNGQEIKSHEAKYGTYLMNSKAADPDWQPIIPEWDDINNKALGASIHEALRKKQEPQAALDKAAQLVSATMLAAGYYKT